jgi:hypothetical protein
VRTHSFTYFLAHYDKLRNTAKYISYAYQLLSERDRFLLLSYLIIVAGRFSVCGSRVSFRVALYLRSCALREWTKLPSRKKMLILFAGRDNIKNVEIFIHVYDLFKLWLHRCYEILFRRLLILQSSCGIINSFLFAIGLCKRRTHDTSIQNFIMFSDSDVMWIQIAVARILK